MVRHAERAGWDQHVVVGVPATERRPSVGGLPPDRIHPLGFGGDELPFPVPGMSDVMPYDSTRFSLMSERRLARYRDAWCRHIGSIIGRHTPDLIQSHHLWIVSSLLKDLAPNTPVVSQCHATGFRQMELAPHLAPEVKLGCARNDRFLVLHGGHQKQIVQTLGVPHDRIHVVAAGYRQELFHSRGRDSDSCPRLLFVGKFSSAKGLPWLLDAFDRLRARHPTAELHIAGGGSGPEAEALRERMKQSAPSIEIHGQLPQRELGDLMRRCTVCVLPSFYEGLPLVLVEALACGCRLVATDLPGVVDQLAPHLGDALELVSLPRLTGVDTPHPDDLPDFVDRLKTAIARSLERPPLGDPEVTMPGTLEELTWSAVFRRVERVWVELLDQ